MTILNNFEGFVTSGDSNDDTIVLAILIGLPSIETLLSKRDKAQLTQILYVPTSMTPEQGLALYADRKPEPLKIVHVARIKSDGQICTLVEAVSKDGVEHTFEIPHENEKYYLLLPVELRTKYHTFTFVDMPKPVYILKNRALN